MGDHSECLQLEFDPKEITYKEVVDTFWSNHNPMRSSYRGRQYMSILFYHDDLQKQISLQRKKKWEKELNGTIVTEMLPFSSFYLAEDRHQKYFLKRWPHAVEALTRLYPSHEELINSTLAARLNGFVKGYGSLNNIKQEIVEKWNLSTKESAEVIETINAIRW